MEWSELMLVDKPTGITSFDVIRRLRKQYTAEFNTKAPKMGHAGTLDPAASGLMLIGVGAGTKKLTEYIKLDKTYEATVCFGIKTTTGDVEGEVLESKPVIETAGEIEQKLAAVVENFTGTHTLPVSAYSAIKKDGVPMYKRARAAEKEGMIIDDVPVREMRVLTAEVQSVIKKDEKVYADIVFSVASGTYIRSLAEELGKQIGYPAHLTALRRTVVGEFTIADAVKI